MPVDPGPPSVVVRMFGPLTIRRDGVVLSLPASRKVRALFAYLALAPQAVGRHQLCELLWEVPNDPRGELRWCLSKIRGLIDQPDRRRVDTQADTVRLNLDDCIVDAIEISQAAQQIETIEPERLRRLAASLSGDFLDGLTIDRAPAFDAWITRQRRQFRTWHVALLERLVQIVPRDEAIGYLGKWLELAPFDQTVHVSLFNALARRGQIREGEEHLAATTRLFESEGLESAPLRNAWRSARAQGSDPPREVATVPARAAGADDRPGDLVAGTQRRASIAVMPFVDRSSATARRGGFADALADDVITRLAKLRSLFVIARGTVFALQERRIDLHEAGQMLGVNYLVSGSVQRQGKRLAVTAELTETQTGGVVWTEILNRTPDDVFLVLDEISNRIVASVANEIEAIERNRAILQPPNSLDAWQSYHRGLWHVYRNTLSDNQHARHYFEMAVRLDPTFSRAHAGRSFTHFQSAFQGWAQREPEIARAVEAAQQGLMADDRDPAAHWAMGRSLWLRGQHGLSLAELERSIDLSPNFALGHYALAFVHSQAGDPSAAIVSTDLARNLSPFDPMLYGMFAVRAIALVRMGRFEEAADWAVKAAARPNGQTHTSAGAAFCLALAGRLKEARAHLETVFRMQPHYGIDEFITATRLAPEAERLFRDGARRLGLE